MQGRRVEGIIEVPRWVTEATRELLEVLGYKGLFPPQAEALERGIEKGRSVLVAAPTGAGKTLIAMIAAVNVLSRGDGRVFYVSPLKSVAQEKFQEFAVLERLGFRVRLSVGDYSRGPPEADVVVSTYEKLDSMLRVEKRLREATGLVVIDEVHLIGDPDRGPILEGLVAKLTSRGSTQIVALSATVPNSSEIAEWLGAELVTSTWRPVPLKEGVFKDYRVNYPDGSFREVRRVSGYPDVDLILDVAEKEGQALVFTQSRRRAVQLAKRAAGRLRGFDDRIAREAAREIARGSWGPASMREELSKLLLKGCSYHHAGLPYEARLVVEEAFRKGGIVAVYSTPTLSAGVNLPARVVIVDEYYRYRDGFKEPISVAEYKQLAGRAGRPGYDDEGEAVIIASPYDSPEELMEGYILAEPERVESKLGGLKGLRHFILGLIASEDAGSLREIFDVVGRTLYYLQKGSPRQLVMRSLRDLSRWGLIEIEDRGRRVRVTSLGWHVARLYLDPETVPVAKEQAKRNWYWGELELLYLVSSMPDMVLAPATFREEERIVARVSELSPRLLGIIDEFNPAELRVMKTALALYMWINEASDDEIYEGLGLSPGDLASIRDTAEWIASGLSVIGPYLGLPEDASERLKVIARRVRYGVKDELLSLVSIPGVGRVKARILFNAGYRSISDLASADPLALRRLPGLGPATLKNILEAAGRLEEADSLARLSESERKGLLAFFDE